ncbi:hypothetical protein AMATHDRAFT_64242 [Amanita thiersii Skay4041]|uniref:asparagine--tRNA ligase n=1 Tax=Amanita thiersii Skay4041 TaxID=703135 RepID=A0A2A9NMQ7_9AGAR|nr:hypothetical protein AMATHDRAFT_64242 [Amanita thiersii Skay4041]
MIFRRLVIALSTQRRSLSQFSPTTHRLPPSIHQLLSSSTNSSATHPHTVTISGWIKSIRRQKNVCFAVITDGSSAKGLQAVFVGRGKDAEEVKRLTNGAAVRLTGKLVTSPGKGQAKELVIELEGGDGSNTDPGRVELLGECPPETYPIQKQSLSTEYLREHTHLRARTDRIASMIRLRSTLKRNINDWFEAQGFHFAHTPILTSNDAEGGGEAFRIAPVHGEHPAAIAARQSSQDSSSSTSASTGNTPSQNHAPTDFFSRPAYLTVSHQLHLEALCASLSRVYTLSPCFRAEPSLTGRHLSEFWMLEAEWAFDGFDFARENGTEEICKFVEALLRSAVAPLMLPDGTGKRNEDVDLLWKHATSSDAPSKLASLENALSSITPWTRISYSDGIRELAKYHEVKGSRSDFKYEPTYGRGLQSEHERWLAETLVGGPVFVTDYPAALKPFYMRRNNNTTNTNGGDGDMAACFDLLMPGVGELVGGSVREERLELLAVRMEEAGMGGDEYEWYRDLRRYGSAPHGGFGMGFERLVALVGGVENIRECVVVPRWAGRMAL